MSHHVIDFVPTGLRLGRETNIPIFSNNFFEAKQIEIYEVVSPIVNQEIVTARNTLNTRKIWKI